MLLINVCSLAASLWQTRLVIYVVRVVKVCNNDNKLTDILTSQINWVPWVVRPLPGMTLVNLLVGVLGQVRYR